MTSNTGPDEARKALAAGLGRVPSGLFVITATPGPAGAPPGNAGGVALLASWVQQCSFDPPRVSLAVKPERDLATALTPGAEFTVNILAEGSNALVGHFARGPVPGAGPFDGQDVERPAEGGVILRAALAWLRCRVTGRTPAGDHDLVIADVTAGQMVGDGRPYVHVRKNGLSY